MQIKVEKINDNQFSISGRLNTETAPTLSKELESIDIDNNVIDGMISNL